MGTIVITIFIIIAKASVHAVLFIKDYLDTKDPEFLGYKFVVLAAGTIDEDGQLTIGGYNALLQKQKKKSSEAIITTVLFDDKYELLHDRINLRGIELITDKMYFVRGSTALLDAVGKTIDKIGIMKKHSFSN